MKFYEDPLIPRTNNNIERYFGITLPSYIKRKYRSIEGLTRWLRLQKIRWIRRNVLQEPEIENLSTAAHLQEKKITQLHDNFRQVRRDGSVAYKNQ